MMRFMREARPVGDLYRALSGLAQFAAPACLRKRSRCIGKVHSHVSPGRSAKRFNISACNTGT